MSLRNISTQEYRQIAKICERVHRTLSNEPFTNHLYVVLKDALPSVHFTIDHFSLKPLTMLEPLNQSLPDITFTMFQRFMHQHPGLQRYAEANQRRGSLLTELDPARYHKTELYNEVYRPVDINDQVWLAVGDRHELIAASYSRETAYTEHELLKLSLIQPQIHIAWKNWQRTRTLEKQLQDLQASRIESDEQARAALAIKNALQSLTPRRREIVELVAAGRTNLEIAADLKISRRTVEKHLEYIFAALGVRTRTALIYETGFKPNSSN
ncbi:MAG: response regulator transcription factor [Kiritimatiellales bacterium]